MPWRGTSRELSLEGVTLKDTNLLSWSVPTSDIFKTQMKQKKHSFRVSISRREKDGTQSTISFVLDHVWFEFQLKYWWLFLGFCKTQVPSRDLWCHQHGHISCCNSWKIREKSYFSFTFCLVIKMVLGLSKYVSMKERKKLWTLHKRKVHIKKKVRVHEF